MQTTKDSLGQFEQLVLTAIVMLGDKAYTAPIQQTVGNLAGRRVQRGPVYITLMRLEEKRYVSSWLAESTPERGGKPKRYFRLEPLGERALRESAETARRIYDVVRSWRPRKWKPSPAR
jgi:DNA-binding PadR family transcriptional regulator